MTDRLSLAISELVEALAESVRADAASVMAAPDRLYDLDACAALLSLGRSKVYAEIAAGRLRTIKVGRRRLVSASAVRDYITERAA